MSAITSRPVVEVTDLKKIYGPKKAIDGISFAVQPGEIFGILGPNGAGKTTTVECLAGLRKADNGRISVLGIDPQANPRDLPAVLGIQLQEAHLHDKIKVREALTMFATCYANPADIDHLISALSLDDKRNATFDSLSGGQKQRLSIALALVGNPKVVILDELTTGLDPVTRRQTWELVKTIRDAGVTVILVSHLMDEVEYLADRLIVIDQGRVTAEGTPQQLIDAVPDARNLEDVFFALTTASTLIGA
ncbi:MAG: ABC transporter ATP-binding protein [Promicromonosporaceae bacterium]|nr:ABC transporter ATP-binding protein [Promicromonosporaceae bacterium]